MNLLTVRNNLTESIINTLHQQKHVPKIGSYDTNNQIVAAYLDGTAMYAANDSFKLQVDNLVSAAMLVIINGLSEEK